MAEAPTPVLDEDSQDHHTALRKFFGDADEAHWANIVKSLNRGTSPYVIKTGQAFTGLTYTPELITFEGIEKEARVLPASWALSPQSPANGFSNGFAYKILPANSDIDLYFTIELEEWWLPSSLGIYMEWANLGAAGDVRWIWEFKECDIALETFAQADTLQSRTVLEAAPATNANTTSKLFDESIGFPIHPDPGGVAAFYSLRISRNGAHASDTAGDVAFIATNYTRGL